MIDGVKLRAIRTKARQIKAGLALKHVTELRDLCNDFLKIAAVETPKARMAKPGMNRMESGGLDRATG
jgi:hypothetical protein